MALREGNFDLFATIYSLWKLQGDIDTVLCIELFFNRIIN